MSDIVPFDEKAPGAKETQADASYLNKLYPQSRAALLGALEQAAPFSDTVAVDPLAVASIENPYARSAIIFGQYPQYLQTLTTAVDEIRIPLTGKLDVKALHLRILQGVDSRVREIIWTSTGIFQGRLTTGVAIPTGGDILAHLGDLMPGIDLAEVDELRNILGPAIKQAEALVWHMAALVYERAGFEEKALACRGHAYGDGTRDKVDSVLAA